jgi:hypothetical protein
VLLGHFKTSPLCWNKRAQATLTLGLRLLLSDNKQPLVVISRVNRETSRYLSGLLDSLCIQFLPPALSVLVRVSPAGLEDCCNGRRLELKVVSDAVSMFHGGPTPPFLGGQIKNRMHSSPTHQSRRLYHLLQISPHPSISHPYDITPAPQLHYSTLSLYHTRRAHGALSHSQRPGQYYVHILRWFSPLLGPHKSTPIVTPGV